MVTSTSDPSTPTTLNVFPGAIVALPETLPFTVRGTTVSAVSVISGGYEISVDLGLDSDGSSFAGCEGLVCS